MLWGWYLNNDVWGTDLKETLCFCSTHRSKTQILEHHLEQRSRTYHLPGGRCRYCAVLEGMAIFFRCGGVSRSSLCGSTHEEPLQAVMSAQESGPSLRLSLDLRAKLIVPKPSFLSTCQGCHCLALGEPSTRAIIPHSASEQRPN